MNYCILILGTVLINTKNAWAQFKIENNLSDQNNNQNNQEISNIQN